MFHKNSGTEKIYGKERGRKEGLSSFSVKIFCIAVRKKFVEDSLVCLTKIWYRKNIATREGASITIFRQIVLSHSTESSPRGIFLCFRKFRVSKKKVMPKKRIYLFFTESLLSHCS